MVSPHIRSAVSTAARIDCSAWSMSMTLPLRRPRDSWWPMPMTRSVPPSLRAMKQQTLDEPTSRAAISPLRETAIF
jgi:hypothetical protein